jgi:Flp pilus assembly protein TadD
LLARWAALLSLACLAACESSGVIEPTGQSSARAGGAAAPGEHRPFHLSAATAALVDQARTQATHGQSDLALTTLDRALRIEPENPLLWIELAQVHEGAAHYELADSVARKALQLAAGDPILQARAWHLIADSLRARDLNADAHAADAHAQALAPH